MKILITHIDLDGFGGNVLEKMFHNALGFDKVLNCNYGLESDEKVLQYIMPENSIIMMDLSIPEVDFKKWKETLYSFRVFDHHVSSNYLASYPGNVWDTNSCGTALFWNYYVYPIIKDNISVEVKARIDKFVAIVDAYDRWQEDSDYWKSATRMQKISMTLKTSKFTERMVRSFNYADPDDWSDSELDLILEAEKSEQQAIEDIENDLQVRIDNEKHTFAIVRIDQMAIKSMVCSNFLKDHPEIDYLLTYSQWADKISARTKKDLDLTNIHGINGHKQAAGGKLTRALLAQLISFDQCLRWVQPKERKSPNLIVEDAKYINEV